MNSTDKYIKYSLFGILTTSVFETVLNHCKRAWNGADLGIYSQFLRSGSNNSVCTATCRSFLSITAYLLNSAQLLVFHFSPLCYLPFNLQVCVVFLPIFVRPDPSLALSTKNAPDSFREANAKY